MFFEQTRKLIQSLEETEWFTAVGQPIEAKVDRVNSCEEAVKTCEDRKWEDTHWHARGLMFQILWRDTGAGKGESPRNWNTVMLKVKERTLPIVAKKVSTVVDTYQLPKIFVDQVEWDIMHIVAASEYFDVYQSKFYDDLLSWYLKGHFPCGWNGNYPDGKLIAF